MFEITHENVRLLSISLNLYTHIYVIYIHIYVIYIYICNIYIYTYIYICLFMCLYLFPYTIRSYLLMLGGFGAGVWTSMVPGFTDPAGFVTAAQAVHVISPLETDRLQVPGIRETRQLHSRALSYLFVKGSRISLRKKMEDTKKIVVETLELEKNAVFFVFFVKGFACGCFWKCCKGHFNLCCFYMPGSELPISGMVIPPFNEESW